LLIEVVFVAGLVAAATGLAAGQLTTVLDELRAAGAVRYMSTRLQRARMEAIGRAANVAVRFSPEGRSYRYAVYRDGNGNGVLGDDITRGIDPQVWPLERLADNFQGVEFGTLPDLPSVDAGGAPPGADPIRLGAGDIVSFTPLGTSTTGTVYIRGRRGAQYAIRVFGQTGKTRMVKFNTRTGSWTPL
jgi:hypothetical protein